jgi:hypothetical protein
VEPAVPDEVTVALTEIVSSAREGLLAFAVGTGLQVMQQIMDEQVVALCGPAGRHNRERLGYRHGREAGSVTLGGRRIAVERPRVRAADRSGELAVPAYELFSRSEVLGAMAMERMLAGCPPAATRSGWSRWGTRWGPRPRPQAGRRSRGSSCRPRSTRWPSCSPRRWPPSTSWR